jgi:phospholipid/cholesterol/gamma-HCH transport system substrate-binding protein
MDRSPVRDFIVGLFVLAGIGALAYLSISIGGFSWRGSGGLKVHAYFAESGGLTLRAPVVVAGVEVGEVTAITLDDREGVYRARVDMDLNRNLKLSTDTTASIYTSGMLGDRYVSLQNGADEKVLANNDEIRMTESGMILERILGAIVYGITKDNSKDSSTPAPGASVNPLQNSPNDAPRKSKEPSAVAAPASASSRGK